MWQDSDYQLEAGFVWQTAQIAPALGILLRSLDMVEFAASIPGVIEVRIMDFPYEMREDPDSPPFESVSQDKQDWMIPCLIVLTQGKSLWETRLRINEALLQYCKDHDIRHRDKFELPYSERERAVYEDKIEAEKQLAKAIEEARKEERRRERKGGKLG